MLPIVVLCSVFVAGALGQGAKMVATDIYQDPYTSRFITVCSDSNPCTTANAVCENNRCVCGSGFVAYQDYSLNTEVTIFSDSIESWTPRTWIDGMNDGDDGDDGDHDDHDDNDHDDHDDDDHLADSVTPLIMSEDEPAAPTSEATEERRKRQASAGTTSSPIGSPIVPMGTSEPVTPAHHIGTSSYPFMWGDKQSKEDEIRRNIANVVCAPVAQRDQSCNNDVQCRATMGQNAQCQKFLDGVNGICACNGGYQWTGGKCIYENTEGMPAGG